MLRPEEMERVRFVGHIERLDDVIDKLHQLEVVQFDEPEDIDLDRGNPYAAAEDISRLLVKTRSLISKLPDSDSSEGDAEQVCEEDIERVESEVESKVQELESIEDDIEEKEELLANLKKLEDTIESLELITDYDNLDIFAGYVDDYEFEDKIDQESVEFFSSDDFVVVFCENDVSRESLQQLRKSGFKEIDIDNLKDIDTGFNEAITDTEEELAELEAREDKLRDELKEYSEKWNACLQQAEKDYSTELKKAEAPLKFYTSEKMFVGDGWVPKDRKYEFVNELENVTDDKVHFQKVEEGGEDAPVKYDHPDAIKPFENLLEMYSPPKYTEIDPTLILSLTFPLFYGMMLSDLGYGILTFFVFLFLNRRFKQYSGLIKMMIYSSLSTVFFGILSGTVFGVTIFGAEAALSYDFLRNIPVILDFQQDVMTIIIISLIMGITQLNIGFVIGFYNSLINSGLREALCKDFSWIVFEVGIVLAVLSYLGYLGIPIFGGIGLVILGSAMYLSSAGPLGLLDLVLVVTDLLSYIRLMALGIATVSIAMVINLIAGILFGLGIPGILMGSIVLIFGHLFNIAFQVLGSSLHSLRLNFVEFFDRFYEGGGKKYEPFGK